MQDEDDGIEVTIWVDLSVLPHPILKPDFSVKENHRFSLKVGEFRYVSCVLECKSPIKIGQRGLVKIVFITLTSHLQFCEVGGRVKAFAGPNLFCEGTIEEIVSVESMHS